MSGKPVSARLPDRDRERLRDFADSEGMTTSKALERAVSRGLEDYGYGPDHWREDQQTQIQRLSAELARMAGYGAAVLVGVGWGTAIDTNAWAVGMLAAALCAVVIQQFEPRLTDALGFVDDGADAAGDADGGTRT